MAYFAIFVSYLFPALDIALAVVIGIRFRGSLGGVLGPIAFGLSAAAGLTSRLLSSFTSSGALDYTQAASYYAALNAVSLTALVLLFAALLTGRTPAFPVPLGGAATGDSGSSPGRVAGPGSDAPPAENWGFNWGATGVTPLWLLFHGRVGLGLLLIALNVGLNILGRVAALGGGLPLVFVLVVVGYAIAIGFGVAGNRIALRHNKAATLEEFNRKERGWNIAGVIVFVLVAALNIGGLVLIAQAMSM